MGGGVSTDDETATEQGAGPSGAGAYVVRRYDSLSSIAAAHGHYGPTIWDHPANAALRRVRSNREALLAGDRLTIPPLRPKEVVIQTGATHRFRRRGVPSRIDLVVRDELWGTVFAGKAYALTAGGVRHEGRTDAEGRVRHWVAPEITRGELELWPDTPGYPRHLSWPIAVGRLDPIETVSGVQARLENLGFDCGDERGALGPATRRAIRAFRSLRGLPPGDEIDGPLRAALRERHGS